MDNRSNISCQMFNTALDRNHCDMPELIAHEEVLAVNKETKERITVRINIYRPQTLAGKGAIPQVECALEIIGLYPKVLPATSVSTYQALVAACESVQILLEHKKGAFDFYYPTSGENYFDRDAPDIIL